MWNPVFTDKATFQNPVIAEYINEHYIAIKFNAEQRKEIKFQGETYKYVRGGRKGYHTLATSLTRGNLSYPTVVFLDEDKKVIQAIPGFLEVETFDPIIRYFAQDLHKKVPWTTYLADYQRQGSDNDSNNARLVTRKKGN